MVGGILAEHNVNSQCKSKYHGRFFNMVMIVEMTDNAMALTELQRILKEKGRRFIWKSRRSIRIFLT